MLILKKVWSKNMLVPKKCCPKNVGTTKSWSKKMLVQKNAFQLIIIIFFIFFWSGLAGFAHDF